MTAQIPPGLNLPANHVAVGATAGLAERQLVAHQRDVAQRSGVHVKRQRLRQPFRVQVVVEGQFGFLPGVSELAAGDGERLGPQRGVLEIRAVDVDRFAGKESGLGLVGGSRVCVAAARKPQAPLQLLAELRGGIEPQTEASAMPIRPGAAEEGLIAQPQVAAESDVSQPLGLFGQHRLQTLAVLFQVSHASCDLVGILCQGLQFSRQLLDFLRGSGAPHGRSRHRSGAGHSNKPVSPRGQLLPQFRQQQALLPYQALQPQQALLLVLELLLQLFGRKRRAPLGCFLRAGGTR